MAASQSYYNDLMLWKRATCCSMMYPQATRSRNVKEKQHSSSRMGKSCNAAHFNDITVLKWPVQNPRSVNFCFFSLPINIIVVTGIEKWAKPSIISTSGKSAPAVPKKLSELWATNGFQKAVRFYSSIFQDLISEGFLGPSSKVLCVETQIGADVFALKEIWVEDSIGIFKKAFKPLVISGQGFKQPFKNSTFDFVFSCGGMIEKSAKLADFAMEISRTLKPEGLLVVYTGTRDNYSLNSFLDLFHFCKLLKTRDIDGIDSKMLFIREIVMKRVDDIILRLDFELLRKCVILCLRRVEMLEFNQRLEVELKIMKLKRKQ
ncbi:Methyltransferase domain-containing protein [Forsythia ovata]|uniref:Methyltransferase domain-containing protein n=1 Tax=Forsythia ovata TaxID=205694 RepID=A0ABD1X0K1_9LAMI